MNTLKLKIKIIVFFLLLLNTIAFSQQYNFRTYSVEKGLPKSDIFSIIQDSRGYLWLGTDGGGACRFDGKQFVTFNKRNGLIGQVVRAITEDSRGNIWFGTDDGISVFNGFKYFNITEKNGLPKNPILKIYEDSHYNIWVGTSGGGLCKINLVSNDSVTIKTYNKDVNKLQTNYVFDIYEDKSNRLWLALYGGINIITFENDSILKLVKLDQDYDEIPSNVIFNIEEDVEKNLWFGTQDAGAFKIIINGSDSGKVVTLNENTQLNDVTVWDIMNDSKGNLWFATDKGGINKLSKDGMFYITQQNGLSGNQAYKLFEDYENNIWVGTFGSGLCQFLGENFIHFSENDGLANKHVLSILPDKNNSYWIGTDGGGLQYLSFKNNIPQFKTYTTQNGLVDNFVNSIAKDKDDVLWIATQKGVSRYDGKTFKHFTSSDVKMLENQIKSIYVSREGLVWMGTNDGLIFYNGKTFFTKREEDENYALFNYINTIFQAQNGEMWFGTYGGLLRYDLKNFNFYDEQEGLLNKQINCLAEDKFGNILIGTFGSGLYKFNVNSKSEKPIELILNDSLLGSNNISSLLFIDKNTLIVGTDKGFDKVFLDDNHNVVNVLNFNESDGFSGIENHYNSICKDESGNIWFGTIKGLTKYAPELDNTNLQAPITNITSLNLFFENIDWFSKTDSVLPWFSLPKNLILKYSDNHLTFKFSGISYFNSDKVQYKYMLEGLDNTWTPARKEGEAVYPGLPPGDYTFLVIAQNKFGRWNKEPVRLSFTIKPPFWQTTWFYISSLTFIILCFYLFVKLRLRKLKQDKKILEQKVKERTAEIERQNFEILEKNEELHQQNEEILAQRDEIEKQKHMVDEKNKEITDSIRYARRIQTAVLPSSDYINNVLADFFILYKPKDIVSGDFYWIFKKNNFLFVASADCTGHGVPGAFMSMLGVSFLNEIVVREDINTTGKVLDELRINVISSMQQRGVEGEQKDGMDIVFVSINIETNNMQFSGANNPLYIIRNKNIEEIENIDFTEIEDIRLFEIKPDKMPIAIYERMDNFKTHNIDLKKDDLVYLITDGFADQFGGPKGKKFMYKKFKELLIANSQKQMIEQKTTLDKSIEDWKYSFDTEYEQTDDITVVGLKI
ncbi:MAG: hypothetical protein A2046_13230 [Bacteroidetes bacterium GWA2_30_7]|nr:MAG: hypothetical protein A2046_13230 [Bacteroidetes bacterium GWA2_30_7]